MAAGFATVPLLESSHSSMSSLETSSSPGSARSHSSSPSTGSWEPVFVGGALTGTYEAPATPRDASRPLALPAINESEELDHAVVVVNTLDTTVQTAAPPGRRRKRKRRPKVKRTPGWVYARTFLLFLGIGAVFVFIMWLFRTHDGIWYKAF